MRLSASLLVACAACAAGSLACLRPAEDRTDDDLTVGIATGSGLRIAAVDGQAQVLRLQEGELVLWAQAPSFELDVTGDADARPAYRVEVQNCMPGSALVAGTRTGTPLPAPRRAACAFEIGVIPGQTERWQIGPPDAGQPHRFHFAAMGDIQTAMPEVDDVFLRMNLDPELAFVLNTGDVVERGDRAEYELFLAQVALLDIPFYSTIGNHELKGPLSRWRERFGRYSVHFDFAGASFSFVDSGNASFDPDMYERLDDWLDGAADRVHIFGTHYPPIDPIGMRAASFRSRMEAAKLLTRLARGQVDLTLYGHVHSYYAFENAGIPAYISGGGGARPERWDGIGRHYLKITVSPDLGVESVAIVRVD